MAAGAALGAVLLATLLALRLRLSAFVALALFAAGVLASRLARLTERCGAASASSTTWRVLLDDDAISGGPPVHGTLAGPGCHQRVTMFVARGTARAGDEVTVTGAATSGEQLLVRAALLS